MAYKDEQKELKKPDEFQKLGAEAVPFLEGRPVRPEEEAYYDAPQHSSESASLAKESAPARAPSARPA